MRGFNIVCLSDLGKERLLNNMQSDNKVVITTVCDLPFTVNFTFTKKAFKGLQKVAFNLLASKKAVEVSVSQFMEPAILNIDFTVEVLK